MKFKIGDYIWTPVGGLSTARWQSYHTKILDIDIKNNTYLVILPHENYFAQPNTEIEYNEYYQFEFEVFSTREECDKYIINYYFDGLCVRCDYKDTFTTWNCKDCEYCQRVNDTDCNCMFLKDNYNLDVKVADFYSGGHSMEICKFYKPTLPQNIREYISWEVNDDILRNCEFNPDCDLHKYSCHKTCTYEHYMNQRIKIPIEFNYNGRKVKHIQIFRYQWINQDYIIGDKLKCLCLYFDYELNKHSKPRKEDYPLYEVFDELTEVGLL